MSQDQEPEKTEADPAAKESHKTRRIETYDGDPRLLIIAPHGFKPKKPGEKRDDINTAEIAELIQNKLKCRAIINSGIKRSEADLNEISGIEKEPEFEEALRNYADNKTPTLVFWLHGATDEAIKREKDKNAAVNKTESIGLDAVLGYGQGNPPRLTAEKGTVRQLTKALSNHGMEVIPASEELDDFCAHNENRASQWFRIQTNKEYDRIQSIQIEIKGNLRRSNNYPGTAEKIGKALSEMTGIEIQDPAPQAKENKEPIAKDKAIAVVSNQEAPVDDALIEEAYSKLRNIMVNHLRKGMLEAGKYLVEKFYDNNIELARQKNSPEKASLNKLKKKLQNSDGNAPSKTWIYDAVNLAVDHHDYANDSVYGKLGHSHQVNLTYVKDPVQKRELIDEAKNKKYSVAKLKKRIAEVNKKPPLLDYDNLPNHKELLNYEAALLKWGEQKSNEQHEFHQAKASHYKQAKKKISDALSVKKTIEEAEASTKKWKYDHQNWIKNGNSINCCTGCSNDCVYCYNKPMAARWGWAALDAWKNEVIRKKDVEAPRSLFNGRVGFPTSHDITLTNIDACLTVLGKLLRAGNEVLIISKPRLECVKRICNACEFFKDKILFRFTVGAQNNDILKLWEPNAPSFEERKESLKFAYDNGFKTSVSLEPILDFPNIDSLIKDLSPFVNDTIWPGFMSSTNWIAEQNGLEIKNAIQQIEANQSSEKIKEFYERYKDDPKIKWKNSIRKVVGLAPPPAPGLDL